MPCKEGLMTWVKHARLPPAIFILAFSVLIPLFSPFSPAAAECNASQIMASAAKPQWRACAGLLSSICILKSISIQTTGRNTLTSEIFYQAKPSQAAPRPALPKRNSRTNVNNNNTTQQQHNIDPAPLKPYFYLPSSPTNRPERPW